MKTLSKIDLFSTKFTFNDQEDFGFKKVLRIIFSVLIYLLIVLIISITLKEWWEGTKKSYDFYKTSMINKNCSEHNISIREVPPVFAFSYYDNKGDIVYLNNAEEILIFDVFLYNHDQTLNTNFTMDRCISINKDQYDFDYNKFNFIKELRFSYCIFNLARDDIIQFNKGLYFTNFGYNFLIEVHLNTEHPRINEIAFIKTDMYINTKPLTFTEEGDEVEYYEDSLHGFQKNTFLTINNYNNNTDIRNNFNIKIDSKNIIETSIRKTKLLKNDNKFYNEENKSFYFKQDTKYSKNFSKSLKSLLFSFRMALDPEVEVIKFSNMKLLEAISRIGGIIKFLGYFTILMRYLFKKTTKQDLVYDLWDYDKDKLLLMSNERRVNNTNNDNNVSSAKIKTKQTLKENKENEKSNEEALVRNSINSYNLVNKDIMKTHSRVNNRNNYIDRVDIETPDINSIRSNSEGDDYNKSKSIINKYEDYKTYMTDKVLGNKQICCICCRNKIKKPNISKENYKIYRQKLSELFNIRNVLRYLFYIDKQIDTAKYNNKLAENANSNDNFNGVESISYKYDNYSYK